jgi:hypothetical protein
MVQSGFFTVNYLCSVGGEGTFSGLVVVEVLIELLRNAILLSPSAACNMSYFLPDTILYNVRVKITVCYFSLLVAFQLLAFSFSPLPIQTVVVTQEHQIMHEKRKTTVFNPFAAITRAMPLKEKYKVNYQCGRTTEYKVW